MPDHCVVFFVLFYKIRISYFCMNFLNYITTSVDPYIRIAVLALRTVEYLEIELYVVDGTYFKIQDCMHRPAIRRSPL
jgi:hypothetical protein